MHVVVNRRIKQNEVPGRKLILKADETAGLNIKITSLDDKLRGLLFSVVIVTVTQIGVVSVREKGVHMELIYVVLWQENYQRE